jgi:hypothetical protein
VGQQLCSADSVEKLDRSVPRCTAAKIDLSDRPRIDDRDPGNGLTTPANVRKRAPLEFFNRIGQDRTFPPESHMSTRKIFPAEEMIRGEHFADMMIEVGPKLPTGFSRCTLERCHVMVHGFSPSIYDSQLTDCVIECAKRITDRRLPKFFSSDYVRCKFVGRFDGVDFGRDPSPYSGKPDEFGELVDCDFTQSTLDLCRFFSVDISRQKFAPWPQFVIPHQRRVLAAHAGHAWPGKLGVHIGLGPRQDPTLSAIAGTVAGFMKQYELAAEEVKEALDTIGGVLR